MISISGGFNQAYAAGVPKIHKLKYATDVMSASDTKVVTLLYVADILHSYSDLISLSDLAAATLAVQHFNNAYSDSISLTDAVANELAAAA